MSFSFASKILREYHSADITTASGATIAGAQWPARVGTGNAVGPVAQAASAAFGGRRAARIADSAKRLVWPSVSAVVAVAMVIRDNGTGGDGSGLPTNHDGVTFGDGSFGADRPLPLNKRWTATFPYRAGNKNGFKTSPATFSRRTDVNLYYYEFPGGPATLTGLGSFSDLNAPFNSDVAHVLLFSDFPTAAELTELATADRADFKIPATQPNLFMNFADSLGAGFLAGGTYADSDLTSNLLTYADASSFDYANYAVAGYTTSNMLATIDANVTPFLPNENPRRRTVANVLCGINNFGNDINATPESVWADHIEAVRRLRAAGVNRVTGCTLTATSPSYNYAVAYAVYDPKRRAFNQLMRANKGTDGKKVYDAIIDLASLPELSDPSNTTYIGDGLHYTPAGYKVYAAAVRQSGYLDAGSGVTQLSPGSLNTGLRGRVSKDITPNDYDRIPTGLCTIYVGTGGDVRCRDTEGNTTVLKNVPTGTFLPILTDKVFETGTTATDLRAIY